MLEEGSNSMRKIFLILSCLVVLPVWTASLAGAEPKGKTDACLTTLYNYPAVFTPAYVGKPAVRLPANAPGGSQKGPSLPRPINAAAPGAAATLFPGPRF